MGHARHATAWLPCARPWASAPVVNRLSHPCLSTSAQLRDVCGEAVPIRASGPVPASQEFAPAAPDAHSRPGDPAAVTPLMAVQQAFDKPDQVKAHRMPLRAGFRASMFKRPSRVLSSDGRGRTRGADPVETPSRPCIDRWAPHICPVLVSGPFACLSTSAHSWRFVAPPYQPRRRAIAASSSAAKEMTASSPADGVPGWLAIGEAA